MEPKRIYSVVDIETTGGRGYDQKVTEIAIFKFDGIQIVDEFQTLINPEAPIPYGISKLTGITNQMVGDAPKFYEVAKQIVEFTKDTIFVAHHVYFDYNILRREFSQLGYSFKRPKLCTVRLARKYIPGHPSYSLGRVCKDLDIPIAQRHRAAGDARATVELLRLILERESNPALIEETESKDALTLPPGIRQETINNLPESTGVYYFKDEADRVLYVGKALNLKKRIKSHFQWSKKKKQNELKSKISNISFDPIPNEWAALIVEAQMIKQFRPPYNRVFNRINFRFGVTLDTSGDTPCFRVTTSRLKQINPAFHFRSRKIAEKVVSRLYKSAFGVCPEDNSFSLIQKTVNPQKYQERLTSVYQSYEYPAETFTLALGTPRPTVKLLFSSGRLSRVESNADTFPIAEDPDIKRLVLRQLHRHYH